MLTMNFNLWRRRWRFARCRMPGYFYSSCTGTQHYRRY